MKSTAKTLTIGELARRADVGVETIRFYEREGLLEKPKRSAGGYRAYSSDAVSRLYFVHQAKELGFTLREIRQLLELRADPSANAAAVRGRAAAKLLQIERKIMQLQRARASLRNLLSHCPGVGDLDQCAILEGIASAPPEHSTARKSGKASMDSIELTVHGMHCDGCAKTIEALLASEPGVKAATVSFGSESARVLFDPGQVDRAALVAAIERVGYRVAQSR